MSDQPKPSPDQLQWVLDHNMQIRAGHRVQIADAVEAWRALEARCQALAAERDQWRTVAGDFHNALVGHGMAGAFNQRLCRQAVRLFDVLNAKHGIGHPEDVAEIREQIRGAEAQLSALLAVLAEIEPYLQHKPTCPHWIQVRFKPEPGWVAGSFFKPCNCGFADRLAGLRGIRSPEKDQKEQDHAR